MTPSEAENFFDDRTIGYNPLFAGYAGWHWRGQGYDGGWKGATKGDLIALHELLTRTLTNEYARSVPAMGPPPPPSPENLDPEPEYWFVEGDVRD